MPVSTPTPTPDPWPAAMSAAVLAAYIGASERLIWMMASDGRLPKPIALPGSRCTRWRKSDVDEWLTGLEPAGGAR